MVSLICAAILAVAPAELPPHTLVPTPNDAVGWVIADAAALPDADRKYYRWLWIPPWGTKQWQQANSFAVNSAVSQAATIQLPEVSAGGWLVRYDLRRLAPKDEQLARLITVWDGLALDDPYFHVPKQNSNLRAAVLGPHLDQDKMVLLAQATGAAAPILRLDWFQAKALTTTEGGRYYDFMQYERAPKQGTAEAALLATVGADVELSKRVNGDRRVGIIESEVTAKARRVDVGQGAIGDYWVTHDIFDEDVSPERHPLYNLLAFFDRGREIIFERPNGLHGFAITNNTGQLVDSAPPNLVADHEIPRPHTRVLQGAISCIRCHASSGGLQPCENDVGDALKLTGGRLPLDIFDDLGALDKERRENVDRLASLYAGNFQTKLKNGRIKYADAVFAASKGLEVKEASELVAEMFGDWRYAKITPQRALLELGIRVEEKEAVVMLNAMLPPTGTQAVVDGQPAAFEDFTIAAMKAGKAVRRSDFERVYVDMLHRVRITRGEIKP